MCTREFKSDRQGTAVYPAWAWLERFLGANLNIAAIGAASLYVLGHMSRARRADVLRLGVDG